MKLLKKLKKEIELLGPGFVTGAADDDPSGIATYSIAGAKFGYQFSFLSWLLVPMMVAVQEASARLGLLTGKGLAGVLRIYYSQKLLLFTVSLLLIANIINIGADLGMMAQSAKMILGLPFIFWLIIMTAITIIAEIVIPYRIYAQFLRIASMFLLVYALTFFLVTKDWLNVFWQTIIPHFSLQKDFLLTIVGFLGTTISPYLFFWQASEEVEEEIKKGIISDFGTNKPVLSGREVRTMRQ
ncbi:divalent metal cation transporter, partial [Candidatus Gottesmanbacteria bacterium]|nr:divalent metal cation transporter [Candidatus Gottesmanbacteria bacterium]